MNGSQCGLNALQIKVNEKSQPAVDPSDENSTDPSEEDSLEADRPCLCLFDIDRTLTAKQAKARRCLSTIGHPMIWDTAYVGGRFVASEAAAYGLYETFCKDCYLGVVTHGDVSGDNSAERAYFEEHTFVTPPQQSLKDELGWQSTGSIPWINGSNESFTATSPYVVLQPDGLKHEAAKSIGTWYGSVGIDIAYSDVHFFDDRVINVAPFNGTGTIPRQRLLPVLGSLQESRSRQQL